MVQQAGKLRPSYRGWETQRVANPSEDPTAHRRVRLVLLDWDLLETYRKGRCILHRCCMHHDIVLKIKTSIFIVICVYELYISIWKLLQNAPRYFAYKRLNNKCRQSMHWIFNVCNKVNIAYSIIKRFQVHNLNVIHKSNSRFRYRKTFWLLNYYLI